ncbi:hypothetical protein KR093_010756 [Drosophila rubida]|uniref:Hornerin n=1 Tax=Drosophila rubida TaxID=30044 RepID=A0AAD4KFD2_9MUSC|nr:hypothetical protein KR093_010756 [Drosophila rubida]
MILQLTRALFLASFLCLALAKQVQPQQQQQQQSQGTKLKRDAALSFGSGIYHGPSHKYLPPPAVTAGYESTYGSLHGNGLAASSGFDFASLLDNDNTHHYHHYHHQQQPLPHHSPYASNSLHAHAHHGRPVYVTSGSSAGYHQRPHQAPKVETYIVQTSHAPAHHPQQSHGYKYVAHAAGGSSSGSTSGGSSFLSLLGGSTAHKHGGSSSTYLLATPSYSGHGPAQRPSHSHGHGLGLSFGPGNGHGLGQEQEQEHAGYSYDAPSVHFKQPLSSYGVPLLPGYEADEEQHHQQQESAQKQSLDQPPAYALGHKGLGHFSYTSSKPLALNTEIHGQQHVHEEQHNELLAAELSKAPFKPSAFLGAKHEPSNAFDFATPTSQYLQPPTGGASASASGYDYAAPSVLYGAPGQSGDSATPIFEPESTYLPPVTSYGAPLATPTHSYH